MSNFQDQTLKCRDCGKDFTWTVGEQEFYAQKQFNNPPSRCPDCRKAKKASFNDRRGPRQMYDAVCAKCGKATQVPFQPTGSKPILCLDCYRASRG